MLLAITILVVILLYCYTTRNHNYWTRRNIKHDPPIPLLGNHFKNLFGIKSITDVAVELYNKYPNERVIGYYRGNTPELIIRDPDLIRHILNIDFAYFYLRGLGRNPQREPLLKSLFHVDGDIWKLLRQRLTPAFTTAKLKNMFPLVVKCADKLQEVTGELAARGVEYDVRELMARFTTEFIGACGFGIEMDSINNERSQFRDLGREMFSRDWKNFIFIGLIDLFPELKNVLCAMNSKVVEGIVNICTQICEQRNFKPSDRHDFIDLLLELKENGKIKGESIEKRNPDGTPILVEMELDAMCIAAQVFVFFAAGFETSSSSTSFTLHQLAYNLEEQYKVQEEIDSVLLKYDNKLCYNAVAEMNLLDMAFKESLRMFPSLGVLNRVCAKRYTFRDLNITIDPGVKILIPIQAIQNDKKYFENPSLFRPDRFSTEAVKNRHKYAYLPFGEGPRACIGLRLGQMQSLAGLAALLHKFTFEPAKSSTPHLEVNPLSNIVQSVRNGVPLKIKPRK